MKLELYITKDALVYRCDDESPVTMYWSAARNGVEFDDEHHTRVRAFPTRSCYVGSVWITQNGMGMRTFDLPVGMLIVLDGTTVESAVGWKMVSSYWSSRLYQHKLSFERASQVVDALDALSQMRITVVDKIEVRPGCCKLLSFQTPYVLGPLMCAVIRQGTHPAFFMFNRDPQTWRRVPFLHRVTLGQVVLTLAVFALFCGSALLGLFWLSGFISVLSFWNDMAMGLLFTTLAAWVSPDVLGLLETARVMRVGQAVNGSRKRR
jgi:hypothetical protein